ncbi:MAG: hypothetical protein OXG37_09440 [Actinomycetia bacterium]|nr:hypothetical protein [Actinomycetes bacterium]
MTSATRWRPSHGWLACQVELGGKSSWEEEASEHRGILKAAETGDAERAADRLRAQIERSQRQLRSFSGGFTSEPGIVLATGSAPVIDGGRLAGLGLRYRLVIW